MRWQVVVGTGAALLALTGTAAVSVLASAPVQAAPATATPTPATATPTPATATPTPATATPTPTASASSQPAQRPVAQAGPITHACPDGRPAPGFSDVPSADVHAAAIGCIAWWAVSDGTGATTYAPAAVVRRDEMAAFVARQISAAGGTLPANPPDAFTDDDADTFHHDIDALAAAGVVQGVSAGRYAPAAPVSRQEMAAYLVRAYAYRAGHDLPAGGDYFPDDDGTPLEPEIDTAAAAGFTAGYPDGTFRPAELVRRDGMASFLARELDRFVTDGLATVPGAAPATYCARHTIATMTANQRAGQVLMVGVPASAGGPSPAVVDAVQRYHAGSVILTGRSSAGVSATHALVDRLQALATGSATAAVPLDVATDQEGGAVQVLSGAGFSDIPSALAQGTTDPATLRGNAATWARQLAAAGVRLNLAPVMDVVPAGTSNAPIGRYDREFGHTPAVVASHGTAFAQGMADGTVAATLKHFPGLGRASGNTDTTAGVTDTVTTRHDPYLQPFAAGISAGAPLVMISTATYTLIDPAHVAAFSPTVIRTLLRGDLGFTGVVISDDLGSAASVQDVAAGLRAVKFLLAGGDLVLTVDAGTIPAMANALAATAGRDPAFRARIDDAAWRVLTQKARARLVSCTA